MTTTEIKKKGINEYTQQGREGVSKMPHKAGLTYAESGVDMRKEDIAMDRIVPLFEKTYKYRTEVGKCVTPIGHFAGLVQLNKHQVLAIKTDGVGTKVFIAEMMEKAKTNANEFGDGVKFVSAKPAKTQTVSGYTAIYSFDDISKVTLNQNPGKKTPGESKKEGADAEAAKNDAIKFAFKKGPVSRLSVTMPPPKTDEKKDKKDEAAGKDQSDDPNAIEMLKSMFKDMKVSIVLNMIGDIVKTNATYRTDKKITLIDMDFGKLINDMPLLKKINQAQPQSVEEVKAMVKGVEGLKLEFASPVTVDFK